MTWSRLVAALLLVGALAACGAPRDVDASGNRGRDVVAGDRYVAMGDSYTAGSLLGATTGPSGCGQSAANYPHLLAARLDLDLEDVSCVGAESRHLKRAQPVSLRPASPQLDALTEDTALVTLSIGANDDGLFGSLVLTCVGLAVKDPEGAPCTDIAEASPATYEKAFEDIADAIVEGIGEILERAPEARVVVVGYPQVFPEQGRCEQLPLATGDYHYAHAVMGSLNAALAKGADRAGAEFVDLADATAGHDICSADPWIAGAKAERAGIAWHPYAEEHEVVAERIAAVLTGEETPR